MPVIKREEMTNAEVPSSGLESLRVVDVEHGSQSLRIGELALPPGGQIPTHIHPNTEEAMVILEGELDAVVDDERKAVGPGDSVLAPAGCVHGFVNRYQQPARLIFVFPTHQVERVAVDMQQPG